MSISELLKEGAEKKQTYFAGGVTVGIVTDINDPENLGRMKVKLIKEPDNPYDAEAIKVMMKGVGLVGYVANSVYTVKGESRSAGRIYDHIGKKAKGTVKVVLQDGVICKLDQKK